jgi:hypothetical protein
LARLVRNNYFAGRVLTAEDFETEQRDVLERQRRHNRHLHGSGIVDGLNVAVKDGASPNAQITISPGFAITPEGDEICVGEIVGGKITGSPPCFVVLQYVERRVHLSPSGDALHVAEDFEVAFAPASQPAAVPLARLTRKRGKWSVDRAYRAPRLRRRRKG